MPKARTARGRGNRPGAVKLVAAGVGGVFGILVGLGLFAAAVAQWSERIDYLAARRCGTAESNPCVHRVSAVVTGKRVWRGRSDSYDVSLRLYDAPLTDPEVTVDLPAPDDVWPLLRRGYPVTALLWRYDVAAVEVEGVRAETEDSPAIEPVQRAVYGLLALVLGTFGVLHAANRLARASVAVAPFGLAAFVAAVMMEPLDVYDPAALASAFALVAGGLAALVAIRRQLRR